GAEVLDHPRAALADLAVHIDIAVRWNLGEPIGHLTHRDQHRTGDSRLRVLPRFANVDEHRAAFHGGEGVSGRRLDGNLHHTEYAALLAQAAVTSSGGLS